MRPNDATLRQIEAADPTANTWLSANAGSGKTRVLTDRVARLLLAGVSPQNILCLTYTKAAASEMQNRLFKRLGEWAMKPDEALRAELAELGEVEVADLGFARQLFARAIETPGGLRIQTIHSFCAAILRRFPLEAEVTPHFTEMDERTAKILQTEVVEDMAAGIDRPRFEALAEFYSGEDIARLTREILSRREAFVAAATREDVWVWFDLPPGFGADELSAMAFAPGDAALIAELRGILATGSKTEITAAAKLAAIRNSPPDIADLPVLESVFLTGAGAKEPFAAKIGSFPTKDTRNGAAAHLMPALEGLMARVETARDWRIRLETALKTLALHRFAQPFLAEYERRKQLRGWLDFDDLILRAGRLVNDPAVAAWVLFRLDGGIDHILVDEAQDTSPAQWRVIESLAREFTTGDSARSDRARTIFVVGDRKQSIYSFQGADPAEFTRMRDQFGAALGEVGQRLGDLQLEYSFRSSLAVLVLVDTALAAVPGLGQEVKHRAFHGDRPGRVDLWPVVETPDADESRPWTDPLDTLAPEDGRIRLSNSVADAIAEMLAHGAVPDDKLGARPIRPRDILVLVRRRSEIFHQIIRACKTRDLPIAGADRLRIGGELAVKDLTAVLAFLATPEDDLSLAAALRSPMFGLDENALFNLAHGRGKRYLWNVLRERSGDHADTLEILGDLRDQADFLRPYDLLDRLLTRHDGRRRLIARLGPEAEDGIDALLTQAMAYERTEVPSLTGFLTWLAAEEVEIKRQMDSAGDQIRVMTVHGAKGLEAPIVILPDTARRRPPNSDQLVLLGGDRVAWRSKAAEAPASMQTALHEKAERGREEDMRLLYVAMTRAESWLIVAAAGDVGNAGDSWYRIVEAGLQGVGAEAANFALGAGLRSQVGDWPDRPGAGVIDADESPPQSLPDWATTHPGAPVAAPAPLVPSDLGGAKIVEGAEDGADLDAALRHGRQIHRLLEFLPVYDRADWPRIARDLLAFGEDAASPEMAEALLTEIFAVLDNPDLAPIFAPGTLAEVEISAPVDIAGRSRIHGVIDRLIVGPDSVLAVDFKTNQAVPGSVADIPEGILRQLGAYEVALQSVYPGRVIETAVLWTRTGALMHVPSGIALRAFGRLDGPQGGS